MPVSKIRRPRHILTALAVVMASGAAVASSTLPAAADGPPTGLRLSAACENGDPTTHWSDWSTAPLQLHAGQDDPLLQQVCELDFQNYSSTASPGAEVKLTLTPQSVAATGFTASQLAQRLIAGVGTQSSKFNQVLTAWTVGADGSLSLDIPNAMNIAADQAGGSGVRFFFVGAPTKTSALLAGDLSVTSASGTALGSLPVSIHYTADGTSYTPGTASTYVPTRQARLADVSSVAAGHTAQVKVSGVDGVPTSGVTAVVLNVTAAGAAHNGYVTAYADGAPRPAVSSLNYSTGQDIANEVTVPVIDGKVDLYTTAGPVRLIADLAGYYSGLGDRFVPTGPTRIGDTRTEFGFSGVHLGAGSLNPASWANGIPSEGVTAVDLHITATDETGTGYLQAYPEAAGKTPDTSALNYVRGQSIGNQVLLPLGAYGQLDFWSSGAHIDAIADLYGYYAP